MYLFWRIYIKVLNTNYMWIDDRTKKISMNLEDKIFGQYMISYWNHYMKLQVTISVTFN